ncbi:tRNA pseudouridine synthase D [Delitschia confertaspora ATCC 74209]|uniref:tRNA pseudouridine synthase D n=1 Tax=Delitschia confertaspora ATCC 74209 TaxID=1513339 RepID=A0A9P4MV96_9PLEO|nr:tRNA pseudouridine synthase D [Delitschia confertaspora ATCC 74209]
MTGQEPLEEQPRKRARLSPSAPQSNPTSTSTVMSAPAQSSTEPTKVVAEPIVLDGPPTLSEPEKEVRAGITEYVSPENVGFTGILKQRYTDFLVNEISLSGKVLHLKSIGLDRTQEEEEAKDGKAQGASNGAATTSEVKPEEKADEETKPEEKVDGEPEQKSTELSDSDKEKLHAVFGEKVASDLVALIAAVDKNPERKARDFRAVTSEPIADKWDRTKAHQILREIFPDKLESSTGENDCITIKPLPPKERGQKRKRGDEGGRGGSRARGERGGRPSWDALGGEYLHFTLYKENKDTMEVVGFLGSKTKVGSRGFGFAGTKDRRACTVQRVSVKRIHDHQMANLGRMLRQAAIGDFKYEKYGLELGDLAGNEFGITLRDCHFENEAGLSTKQRLELANSVLSKAVKDFSEKGFINYYGLQRFGSFAASTDAVGVKLLQDNLAGAISDILAFSSAALEAYDAPEDTDSTPTILISRDDKARAKGINIWKTTGDADAALNILPRKFAAESSIIKYLGQKNRKTGNLDRKNDYRGALAQIPRNLRLMYVHAYQSFIWNVVAGKRWTQFGSRVIEGDLVLVNEHKNKDKPAAQSVEEEVDQDGEVILRPAVEERVATTDDFERARALTKEEAESGKYSIFDVVLPLPGWDVEYPKNEVGEFYKEFMKSERGGGLDPHDMRRNTKDFSLSGSYRKMLARPLKEVVFEVKSYAKDDEQFVETDLQRILEKKNGKPVDMEMKDATEEPQEDQKVAIILNMQLGTSQYATMALRELMKPGGVQHFKPEYMGGR